MKNSTSKNVRIMQRDVHFHNQRIVRNDRYWCDVCNYAWPRSKFYANGKSPFSKQSRFKGELNTLTVPALRERVLKRRPNVKGVSKMRKADLVAALLES